MPANSMREDIKTQFRYIVVVAASAGGLPALSSILSVLPPDFLAPLVVVQHLSPNHPSFLVQILQSRSRLIVKEAQAGDVPCWGMAYIAPVDKHVLFDDDGRLVLSLEPKVQYVRPAADVLFNSAAALFKEKVIAGVLTGAGSDGAAGVTAVAAGGGTVIAQDQSTSEHYGMPEAAILTGNVDYILPLNEIGPWLIKTVMVSDTN